VTLSGALPTGRQVEGSRVQLKVYDVLGNEIATLVNEQKNTGSYEVNWNASNYPSGVYFYRLQAGTFTETKKMLLLK
ncbi:MAG: T9SS type A sorting domain-containing protein, partial [Ignavibacterium sp.]|nr:T9SS type A sorting domain-containing protein [Ignavibacterium sp.]